MTMYVCDYCGYESVKWLGKCPACNRWGTMKEIKTPPNLPLKGRRSVSSPFKGELEGVRLLHEIEAGSEPRMDMGDGELNRVLGGGMVPGSLVLLGGEPGIGKSTLTLQTVLRLQGRRILYISGEESARQIKLRADRLGPANEGLYVLCETSLEKIFQHIEEMQSTSSSSTPYRPYRQRRWNPPQVRWHKSGSARRLCSGTPRAAARPSCSSDTSTRKARWQAPRYWSTLWMSSFSSRATSITSTASCEALRIDSVAPANWAFMRCDTTDFGK